MSLYRGSRTVQLTLFQGHRPFRNGGHITGVRAAAPRSDPPLSVQRDFGRLHVGVLPLHLRAVHEVAQGVKGLGLPVHRRAGLLVDRRSVAGVLDVQRLEVVHGPGHQVTCRNGFVFSQA